MAREYSLEPTTASINEVLEAGRKLGAEAIQANHPTNSYGYVTNLEEDSIPGGANSNFNLLEMNAGYYEDTWKAAQQDWNRYWIEGESDAPHVLGGGSDTHDVWEDTSGSLRLYARPNETLTVDTFTEAVKQGHAYASLGPLIYPETAQGKEEKTLFGKTYSTNSNDAFEFTVDLRAMQGLKKVTLVQEGEKVDSKDLSESGKSADSIQFSHASEKKTWYAIVVEDQEGNKAYSNPVWVEAD